MAVMAEKCKLPLSQKHLTVARRGGGIFRFGFTVIPERSRRGGTVSNRPDPVPTCHLSAAVPPRRADSGFNN